MFGDYSLSDLGAIFAMQGFAGLILFSVYVLMALGLAIIFGQMGVINMAHGEFMILGAYVTWMTSNFFQSYLPSLFSGGGLSQLPLLTPPVNLRLSTSNLALTGSLPGAAATSTASTARGLPDAKAQSSTWRQAEVTTI